MAKYSIKQIDRHNEHDYKQWVRLLKQANGETLFHHPDFLSYHNDRFDEHHLGIFKGEELFGLLPIAIIEKDNLKVAKSPYGASYGGFIFKSILSYTDSKEITTFSIEYLKSLNVNKIIITPSLPIYHNNGYSDTFSFSLLEQGFKIINSDITSVVSLNNKDIESEIFTSKIRNVARKARKARVEVQYKSNIDDFWLLMDRTFSKHGSSSTHTKEEYENLIKLFPDNIYCNVAYLDEVPIAGMGVFEINNKNIMSFYLCSDSDYQQTQAMSLLIYETILKAEKDNFHYFDFGTSSVNMIGRENIFRFKESFGAIGNFRNTYVYESTKND